MSKTIEVSDLRKEYADKIEDLAVFLGKNLHLEPVVEKNSIILTGEFSRKNVRALIRRFLHKNGITEHRLISDGGIWKIKKRKEYQI